jgi:hypothetical protein
LLPLFRDSSLLPIIQERDRWTRRSFFYVFSWLRESSKLILQETDFVLSHQVTGSEGLHSFEGEARNPIFARTDAVHDILFRSSRGAHPLLTVGVLCTDLNHSRPRVGGIEMIKHVWKCR